VGKTTLAALLSHLAVNRGFQVLAVDADPQENLAFSLGVPPERARDIIPLSRHERYIQEKTGAQPGGGWGQPFTINPDVSDVVDRFGIRVREGLNLLVMGSVDRAASGCLCPEHALLASILRHLRLREEEMVILDTQAGVEHFGRALAEGFQHALIVADPTFNALQVAHQVATLATDLGIPSLHLVVNRVRTEEDVRKIKRVIPDFACFRHVFTLPFADEVRESDPDVTPLLTSQSTFLSEVQTILSAIQEEPIP
jgi:CO dehydrogenase maturation factor